LPKDAVVEIWKERKGQAAVLDATVKAGWDVVYTTPDWRAPTTHRSPAKRAVV